MTPDALAMARAMQAANAISMFQFIPWESIDEKERNHWVFLAKAALTVFTAREPGVTGKGEGEK